MAQNPDYPPAPGERIERTEVVEHTSTADAHTTRRAAPMWVWILPLVVLAIILAWYVFTRGEPNAPDFGDAGLEAPEITVEDEPDPVVIIPQIEQDDPPVETQTTPTTQPSPSSQPIPPTAEQPAPPPAQ